MSDNSDKYLLKWVNMILKPRDIEVEDVKVGFKDGFALVALLEEITGFESPKKLSPAKNELLCLNNLQIAIEMINSHNLVKQLCVDARNFYSGQDYDEKLIFGFIFDLLLHQSVNGIQKAVNALQRERNEKLTAERAEKDQLLQWCNLIIQPYSRCVSNFTSDWLDGRAYAAIIASCGDAAYLRAVDAAVAGAGEQEGGGTATLKQVMRQNLRKNEEVFGVRPLLDEEFIDNPSDRANIIYVGMIYKNYERVQRESAERKRQRAGAQIARVAGNEAHLAVLAGTAEESLARCRGALDELRRALSRPGAQTGGTDLEALRARIDSLGSIHPERLEAALQECRRHIWALQQYQNIYQKAEIVQLDGEALRLLEELYKAQCEIKSETARAQNQLMEHQIGQKEQRTEQWKMQFDSLFGGPCKSEDFAALRRQFNLQEADTQGLEEVSFDDLCDILEAKLTEDLDRNAIEQAFKAYSGADCLTEEQISELELGEQQREVLESKLTKANGAYEYQAFCDEFKEE